MATNHEETTRKIEEFLTTYFDTTDAKSSFRSRFLNSISCRNLLELYNEWTSSSDKPLTSRYFGRTLHSLGYKSFTMIDKEPESKTLGKALRYYALRLKPEYLHLAGNFVPSHPVKKTEDLVSLRNLSQNSLDGDVVGAIDTLRKVHNLASTSEVFRFLLASFQETENSSKNDRELARSLINDTVVESVLREVLKYDAVCHIDTKNKEVVFKY
jgi:hypothetical protein